MWISNLASPWVELDNLTSASVTVRLLVQKYPPNSPWVSGELLAIAGLA